MLLILMQCIQVAVEQFEVIIIRFIVNSVVMFHSLLLVHVAIHIHWLCNVLVNI